MDMCIHSLLLEAVADVAIVPWVPLNPPPPFDWNLMESADDGPNGTPPWLKEVKKAVALAHLSML